MADDERCDSVTWSEAALGYVDIRCELVAGHTEGEHRGRYAKQLVRWTVPKVKPEGGVSHGLPPGAWE